MVGETRGGYVALDLVADGEGRLEGRGREKPQSANEVRPVDTTRMKKRKERSAWEANTVLGRRAVRARDGEEEKEGREEERRKNSP